MVRETLGSINKLIDASRPNSLQILRAMRLLVWANLRDFMPDSNERLNQVTSLTKPKRFVGSVLCTTAEQGRLWVSPIWLSRDVLARIETGC
jgi:hypothetical protein